MKELADRLKKMGILNLYACIGYPQVEDEYLDEKQRRVPCASRIRTRGNLPQLRLQIRPLVRYGLDGKNHRRAARGTAGSKII